MKLKCAVLCHGEGKRCEGKGSSCSCLDPLFAAMLYLQALCYKLMDMLRGLGNGIQEPMQ